MRDTLIFDAYTAYLDLSTQHAPDGFRVYDGPQTTYPDEQSFVAVGVEDIQPGVLDVVAVDTGQQDWESLGATARMETFVIYSTVYVWDGMAEAIADCRTQVDSYIQALGAALRPAPHGTGDLMLGNVLNQGGAGTGWCGLSVLRVKQRRAGSGVAVVAQTALACTARL